MCWLVKVTAAPITTPISAPRVPTQSISRPSSTLCFRTFLVEHYRQVKQHPASMTGWCPALREIVTPALRRRRTSSRAEWLGSSRVRNNPLIRAVDSAAPRTYYRGAKSTELAHEPDASVKGSRDTGSLHRFVPLALPGSTTRDRCRLVPVWSIGIVGNLLIGAIDIVARAAYYQGAKGARPGNEPDTSVDGSRETGLLHFLFTKHGKLGRPAQSMGGFSAPAIADRAGTGPPTTR
jgi:hypothetical protein